MSLERFCRHNEKRLRKGEEEVGKVEEKEEEKRRDAKDVGVEEDVAYDEQTIRRELKSCRKKRKKRRSERW